MSLIFSGFSSEVKFDNEVILCNSFGISESSSLIESNPGYGGSLDTVGRIAVGNPYVIDYGDVSGSLSYHPTKPHLFHAVDWLKDRSSAKALSISTGKQGSLTYDECFFTSMGISVSEGDFLSLDLGMLIKKEPHKTGSIDAEPNKDGGTPFVDEELIPYYATSLSIHDDVVSWGLDISQPVVFKHLCSGYTDVEGEVEDPEYALIGPMDIELNYMLLVPERVEFSSIYSDFTKNCEIKIFKNSLVNLKNLVILGNGPQVADAGSHYAVSLNYRTHNIEFF